jgi:hypothetical protein
VSKIISTTETKESLRLPWKKLTLGVGIVLALVAIVIGVIYVTQHDSLPFVAKQGCAQDTQLIEKYQKSYKTGDGDGIKQVNETILSRAKYKSDPTCLYILTRHAFLFGDQDRKELYMYFDLLKESRKGGQDVSKTLNDGVDREKMYKIWQQMQDSVNDQKNREVSG